MLKMLCCMAMHNMLSNYRRGSYLTVCYIFAKYRLCYVYWNMNMLLNNIVQSLCLYRIDVIKVNFKLDLLFYALKQVDTKKQHICPFFNSNMLKMRDDDVLLYCPLYNELKNAFFEKTFCIDPFSPLVT